MNYDHLGVGRCGVIKNALISLINNYKQLRSWGHFLPQEVKPQNASNIREKLMTQMVNIDI